MSRPGVDIGLVASVPSTAAPVATISAWLTVTRIWLLWFVGQFAKKAGVEKNPGCGVSMTSSSDERSVGRSKNLVGFSLPTGGRIVTSFQVVKSVGASWKPVPVRI